MSGRRRYRFVERRPHPNGDRYAWQRPVPGDSRAEEITCRVDWFWGAEPSEPKTVHTTSCSPSVVTWEWTDAQFGQPREGAGATLVTPGFGFTAQEMNLFEQWSDLNGIIADFRSRFDVLRKELPKCRTRAEAQALINAEGFGQRYPHLPDWLT